jgi:hypothetical protein
MKPMTLAWLCTALAAAHAASAQQPSTVPEQVKAMQSCGFLTGRWEGEGWIVLAEGKRTSFHETEEIEPKLGGLLLLVQGLGTSKEGRIIHAALATLSFDAQDKQYHMRAHEQMGHYIDSIAQCRDGMMTWSLPAGPRTLHYTISLNPKGQWHEVGTAATQGGPEQQLFEMTLDKVSAK